VFGKPGSGGEQAIEITGAAQLVEPAQRGKHALADTAVLTEVLDDLQILPGSGLFDAEKHGGLHTGTPP
jgi:hypothetical protein